MSVLLLLAANATAQADKKTDEDKPADPDTGESTVEEKTHGLLPNPLQKYGGNSRRPTSARCSAMRPED
jgi:porin